MAGAQVFRLVRNHLRRGSDAVFDSVLELPRGLAADERCITTGILGRDGGLDLDLVLDFGVDCGMFFPA